MRQEPIRNPGGCHWRIATEGAGFNGRVKQDAFLGCGIRVLAQSKDEAGEMSLWREVRITRFKRLGIAPMGRPDRPGVSC
jgi:hypothetical protein